MVACVRCVNGSAKGQQTEKNGKNIKKARSLVYEFVFISVPMQSFRVDKDLGALHGRDYLPDLEVYYVKSTITQIIS